jgi:calpain-15
MGLSTSHAYSVTRFVTIQHAERGKVHLLRLRNPWANENEWRGDWSDSSPLWTPQLKEQLRMRSVSDGTFYIAFNDFVRYFDNVAFCYYNRTHRYSSILVTVP